jgi:hypothetical protein
VPPVSVLAAVTATGLPPCNVAVYANVPGTAVPPFVAVALSTLLKGAPPKIAAGCAHVIVGMICVVTVTVVVLVLVAYIPVTPG